MRGGGVEGRTKDEEPKKNSKFESIYIVFPDFFIRSYTAERSGDRSVYIMTKLWFGRLGSLGLIPGWAKVFWLHRVAISCMADTVS